jgi:malonyl CoA-acyl carrier protein transacylase
MVILFPGQGSQYIGMGEELFAKYREEVETFHEVLGYRIEEICLVPNEKLRHTSYTQPAIFTVSVLAWMSFEEEWNHPHVDFFLGHSLGEYSALCAAGAFGFRTGLELVRQRGSLMAEAKNGAMAAVTGLPQETVEEILDRSGRAVSICNYNSGDQVVIGGRQEDIEALQAAFSSLPGCTCQQLPVSGAFHSPFMSAAA